jgi:hypothetical protein
MPTQTYLDFYQDFQYQIDLSEINPKNIKQDSILLRWRDRGIDKYKITTYSEVSAFPELQAVFSAIKFSRSASVQDTGIQYRINDRRSLLMMDNFTFNKLFGLTRETGIIFNWVPRACLEQCLSTHTPLALLASAFFDLYPGLDDLYPVTFLGVPIETPAEGANWVDFVYLNSFKEVVLDRIKPYTFSVNKV